jgi:hypothetical protein
MTMNFDFTEAEVSDLYEAVQAHLKELRFELTKTDDRAYQAMLRDKVTRFERIEAKFESASAAALEVTPYV